MDETQQNFPVTIGDWVTQYNAGYWQVIDVKPIYATAIDESNYGIKKGSLRTHYALMKKAFTPKMKFRVAFSYCDISWCKPVSVEKRVEIEEYLASHPKDAQKFSVATPEYPPCVTNLFFQLDEEQLEKLKETLSALPARLTQDEFYAALRANGLKKLLRSHGNYLVNLIGLPWDVDEKFDPMIEEIQLINFETVKPIDFCQNKKELS